MLSQMLDIIVARGFSISHVPTAKFTEALLSEHEIDPHVTLQIMGWFGSPHDDHWEFYEDNMVKTIGLALLSETSKVIRTSACSTSFSELRNRTFLSLRASSLSNGGMRLVIPSKIS
jgi:hypothetical protein